MVDRLIKLSSESRNCAEVLILKSNQQRFKSLKSLRKRLRTNQTVDQSIPDDLNALDNSIQNFLTAKENFDEVLF